ncbi:M23 family metallopeptidase [Arcicella sp. LKC2W]|uniref:M23 family metallopeptidase n=1 Tax=Arcicella sp. LKC2W TaxID=2984198 RepID=UPI002B21CDA5|nr:M23 family metallopeptidase [Arcicella sp. LKC2W]MEA5457552.1 M23 family metallopeptidase [Arcicella sp. LKC2W]
MKKLINIIFLSLIYLSIQAQKPQLTYPKGYFLFPINPNQQNYLAGGMGDLRSDHFHAGIDIKTQGREGLPVYATGDGYISEVRVQTSGYGNVIFITHPNGFVSVYGHLKTFSEPLASYVRKKRLESQTFEIKLNLKPEEFEVARGQIIGLSGNTGGSAGPHLHFEIRDVINNILNPLNFGFPEIKDNLPPIFQQLIIKTLSTDSRINGAFGKQLFYPTKIGNAYSLNNEIYANGELGLELLAVDKMNGTNNSNGLSCVELFVDGVEQYYSHLEQFPNDVSHDINVHNDYAHEQMKGQRFQKLFQEDGNDKLQIYKPSLTKGKIKITDGKTHQITIKIWDTFENSTVLNFTIKGEKKEGSTTISPNNLPVLFNQSIEDNTLIIKAHNLKTVNSVASLKFAKSTIDLPINYVKNNEAVYLWDLKKSLPDSIIIDGVSKATNFRKVIVPNIDYAFESDGLDINFEYKSLYDTLYLQTEEVGNKLKIGEVTLPLKGKIDVIYTPNFQYILPDKTSIYHLFKNVKSFLKTVWNGNKASFSTKRLGDFIVLVDTIPPKASMMKKTPDDIQIRIGDNLSGIRSFKAFVNNEYILTDYDAKRSLLWSVKADSSQRFYGKLRLELEDNQGNKSAFEANIDTVRILPKTIVKKVAKTKKNELKNRRQSPKLRTERPKRKHR